MSAPPSSTSTARVASLHLHPAEPGRPLQSVEAIEAVAGKGILGEPRYFGKISSHTGGPSRRQLSLIEREQLAGHAVALGLPSLAPGAVRANVETLDVNLIQLLGQKVQIGQAILFLYEPRRPCEKMDAVCAGLRERMQNNRQGVLVEIIRTGTIRVGDTIAVMPAEK